MTKLILATPEEKYRILKEFEQQQTLEDFKFISLSELIELFYGTYRDDYLLEMQKRGYLPSVANDLKNVLWYVKDSKREKIKELYHLQQELLEEKIMIPSTYQKAYFKKQQFMICGEMKYQIPTHILRDLEQEGITLQLQEDMVREKPISYTEFSDVRNELSAVCLDILKKHQEQIPLDQMHICNVSSDYLGFCIHLLELFQIPYTMKEQSSIYSLPFIQDFLKQVETLDGSIKQIEDMIQTMVVKNEVEQDALEKLARVYGKYRHNDTSISVFLPVLIYELKHLYLKPVRERNAVTIDSSLEDYGEHDYYFVVGFNQETMPPVSLDLDYINDEEKRELGFMDTTTKNERNKQKVIAYLQSKEDLWISYAKGSSFANFERSPLLEIIKEKRKVEVNTETSIYMNL